MLRSLMVDASKKLILWMLFMLVILFIAGMWILSSLNLSYSEEAISDVRQKQIEETFFNNLNKITQTQTALERYTADLARIGDLFADLYALKSNTDMINTELTELLQTKLNDFVGTSAVGIWFNPDKVNLNGQPISHYVFRDKSSNIKIMAGTTAIPLDQQRWLKLAGIPMDEGTIKKRNKIYWTPTYYNDITDSAVLTLVKPILDRQQQVVGYVSTDWEAKQVIDLVSQVSITPNTFALLIDKNKRKLSSLSRLNNEQYAQKIIDSVMSQDFIGLSANRDMTPLTSRQQQTRLHTHQFTVDDKDYVLYAATTPAEMLFAVGVPKNEIDAVIAPMRDINQRILIATSVVILLLSIYLVYRIALLMQELQASYTDQLTGLPNRARLLLDLEQNRSSTLILINIDRFRELNSIFGNDCGDAVLQDLTENITTFWQNNNESHTAKLYRLSGDEFVLLGVSWKEEFLTGFLRKLSDFLQEQQLQWRDQDISLTATIGAAEQQNIDVEPAGQNPPDILISHATAALRIARDKSRNYSIYSKEQDVEQVYEQNLFWARQLKQALQQDRILPWFQPIYDNQIGRITKYECLIRMIDSEGKIISPGIFLAIASKLRLDSLLTRVMVEKSFQKFANLEYEFSINLSYRDLLDTELTQFIFDKLEEYQVGERLIFEILESDGIDNYNEVRQFIDKAKSFGCKIAIDDFGSGYSNFEHVLRLNVDLIKIDGSLIKNLNEDQSAIVVTRGVVQFARSLGIKTVAEFVHCEAVQKQVYALGIDFSQGAYFSMPQAKLIETNDLLNH